MHVRSAFEIGQVIRSRREARGMAQAALATAVGASRKWVVEAEAGKPTAEIGRVLRALAALGVVLSVEDDTRSASATGTTSEDIPEVDDVLATYRARR